MAFLRWGITMADEIPETAGAATRSLLGAVGFILILLGGEILLDKTGDRFSLGIGLVAVGTPVFFLGVFWKWVQQRLAAGVAKKLNWIASDPIWWVALFSVFTSFSFTQFGLLPTAAILVPLGIAYAVFMWRKAAKATAPIPRNALELANAQLLHQKDAESALDVLHMLDFGVYQTTYVMLSQLVDNIPAIYNVDSNAPLPLELANQKAHNDAQVFMQSVRNRICDGSDRASKYMNLMYSAERMAEHELKITPPEQRPAGIDPLVLRDYAIAFRQAVLTASFLRGQKHEIEDNIISQRRNLIERRNLRTAK